MFSKDCAYFIYVSLELELCSEVCEKGIDFNVSVWLTILPKLIYSDQTFLW